LSSALVWLGHTRVGILERFDDDHIFAFDQDYLRLPERPVLGQFFEDRLPEAVSTFRLLPWFQQVLPQGPLKKAIASEAGLDEDDELGLLVWLGEDLPGAVRVTNLDGQPGYRRAKQKLESAPPSAALRVSLAGVHWKVALSTTERGFTLPVRGRESAWIAKFQGREWPRLVQVEFATMTWARLSGLVVPEVLTERAERIERLPPRIPVGDGLVLLVPRFDRSPGGRIHIEDFAQILDRPDQFSGAFEEIAVFVKTECPQDRAELIRRLAFMIGSGNGDAHLKNWSIWYLDGTHGTLAPAYDQVATVAFPSLPPTLALRLANQPELRFDTLGLSHFEPISRALGMTPAAFSREFCTALRAVIDAFPLVAASYSSQERDAIEAHLGRLRTLAQSA
jgi:serine/threonine-protein kinase HipA